MPGTKPKDLRNKSKSELEQLLNENKKELAALRVAKVTGGAPNKLSKMCVLRRPWEDVLRKTGHSNCNVLRSFSFLMRRFRHRGFAERLCG